LGCAGAHVTHVETAAEALAVSIAENARVDLVSAHHIMQIQKKPNHVALYQHFLSCCKALNIPGVVEYLNKMLAVDFIIANEDRHTNNFGMLRDAETLAWQGPAPIYDCGTSLWFEQPTARIRPLAKLPSKPFRDDHAQQIKLVSDFSWLNFTALRGIDEEFREILRDSAFIDAARCDSLCYALRKRVDVLAEVARSSRRNEDPAR
jgi:hypothetical protein